MAKPEQPQTEADVLGVTERKAEDIYARILTPMANKYLFSLPKRSPVDARPSVLILGNHSSGKSTFINYLLGKEVQRTGLAPIDDGFTIVTHGEVEDELDGPALVSHSGYPYEYLEKFGPHFVSKLYMKLRPIPLLKKITLIDSPGMIDSIDSESGRGYDFLAVVREFAETADAVLLFFDPDKPGTTGETLTALKESLAGLEHKMLLVINKVDRFESMRDFARAYGVLCWNLARVIRRKDVPHIFNMYIPGQEDGSENVAFPLDDFDKSRAEVVHEVERAPQRRVANIVSQLYETAKMLYVHVRVCRRIAWELTKWRFTFHALTLLTLILTGVLGWFLGGKFLDISRDAKFAFSDLAPAIYTVLTGLATAGAIYLLGRFDRRGRAKSLTADLDDVFRLEFFDELKMRSENEDLDIQSIWEKTKNRIERALGVLDIHKRSLAYPGFRRLARLKKAIDDRIPALQSEISEISRKQRSKRLEARKKDEEKPVKPTGYPEEEQAAEQDF